MYNTYFYSLPSEKRRTLSLSMHIISSFKTHTFFDGLGMDWETWLLYIVTPKQDGDVMSEQELLAKYIKGNCKSELNKI